MSTVVAGAIRQKDPTRTYGTQGDWWERKGATKAIIILKCVL